MLHFRPLKISKGGEISPKNLRFFGVIFGPEWPKNLSPGALGPEGVQVGGTYGSPSQGRPGDFNQNPLG